jgi:uracil-DNA glycosylase
MPVSFVSIPARRKAMGESGVKLEESWKQALAGEFAAPYMASLKSFLTAEKEQGKVIFPRGSEYFRALDLTPLGQVKVVILGQDPYHGEGQAHGLCFSVRPGVRIPPSLVNIYKELQEDLGIQPPRHGYLEYWAKQGVLLLNSVLTVERSLAASHQGKGWERFTDAVIARVNEQDTPAVFMLWGSYAQRKAAFVDQRKHLVLKAPHPSPLSAHNGFFGSRHFSKANDFLKANGLEPIDWQLPEKPEIIA